MLQSLKACPSGPLRVKVPWDLQLKVLCLPDLRSEIKMVPRTKNKST